MTLETIEYRSRAEWLALRKQDVTASELAALFDAHPYRTKLAVYLEKTVGGEDQGDNIAMRRGRILEPAVAQAVIEDYPAWHLTKAVTYHRDSALRLGATPDYWIERPDREGRGVLEVKTVAPEVFERDWKGTPPLAHTLQTIAQMMTTDAPWGMVAVMIDNHAKDIELFDVPRHPGAEAKIREAVDAFWDAVKNEDIPGIDYARDASSIAAMFPRDNGAFVDLASDNLLPELLEERAKLKSVAKEADEQLEVIDTEIKHKIGDAAEGRIPGWKITLKTQRREERLVPASEFRVLRITKLREVA